jgi:CDP-diacylglycerol--glycerol-3-phosphate 3-phosphatidyltransferase
LNPANWVTLFRIAIVPVILFLIGYDLKAQSPGNDWFQIIAIILIIAASISDGIDGWLARKYGGSTIGRIMDPMADKLLIILVMVIDSGRSSLTYVMPWMVAVAVSREILVLTLRIYAAETGGSVQSNFFGKLKTAFQMISLIFVRLSILIRGFSHEIPVKWANLYMTIDKPLVIGLLYLATFLTAASGVVYVYQNFDMIKKGAEC